MKSILILEDDPIWQRKLDEILFQFNFSNLHFCNDLLEVDLFLKKQIADLIIADILIIENNLRYNFFILLGKFFQTAIGKIMGAFIYKNLIA